MKNRKITPKRVSSVPCPICGVTVGKRCQLYSGQKRDGPHAERKLSAIGAIERKKSAKQM